MTARWTRRSWVATALIALACGACDTPQAPASPVISPPPPLRITAFSVAESVDGVTYVYAPTLTLTATDAVTVTALWIELENGYNGRGTYLRDPRLPYEIPAGATRRLFENPPAHLESNDFRAARVLAVVTYVDDSGRSARIETSSIAPGPGVGR